MEQFFIKRQGKVLGPFTQDKIRDLAGRGMVVAEHQISTDRIEWLDAEKVVWLFPQKNLPPEPLEPPEKIKIRTQQEYNSPESEMSPFGSEEERPESDANEHRYRRQAEKRVIFTPTEQVRDVSVFSILGDPVNGLPELYKRYSDDGSLKIGIGMAVVSLLCFFFGIKEIILDTQANAAANNFLHNKLVEIIIAAIIPFVSLAAGACIIRLLLGADRGGIGGDVLIAGAALMPFAVGILGVLLVRYFAVSGQDPRLIGILIASIAIYLFSAVILILYSGLTRISGIKENLIVFIIPAMVIISGGVSYLLFNQLFQGKL